MACTFGGETMTQSKIELKKLISDEMSVYGLTKKNIREKRFRHHKNYMIFKAVESLRIYEYRCAKRDNSKGFLSTRLNALLVKIADRKRNICCEKADIELSPNMIGKNIRICHDNVVIFGYVGENCTFHGNNVVGNKRTGAGTEIPKIGNNVDVGFGAMIIGDVTIADNCVIGAGAVVTKSCEEAGSILVGVPAKVIEK